MVEDILEERGQSYGSFENNAQSTQEFKKILHNAPKWGVATNMEKESLEMIVHKISRLINGDPSHLDSWVDIIGYAQLVVNAKRK